VPRDCQWTERAQVAPVFEGEERKGDDDQEDSFFMDVPAEEEGGVAAEREGRDEGVPGRGEEKFD